MGAGRELLMKEINSSAHLSLFCKVVGLSIKILNLIKMEIKTIKSQLWVACMANKIHRQI